MTPEGFSRACVKVFGDPKFRAKLKELDDEYAATLKRLGLTAEDVEKELAPRAFAAALRLGGES